MKQKREKTAKNKCGFDEIDRHIPKTYNYYDLKVYKLFGVQSWVGGIGKHASLKNWKSPKTMWVRNLRRESHTQRTFRII